MSGPAMPHAATTEVDRFISEQPEPWLHFLHPCNH
jgi:hypothetical protein